MKIAFTSKHLSISNEMTKSGLKAESRISWFGYAGIVAATAIVSAVVTTVVQNKAMAEIDRTIAASYGPGTLLGDAFREASEEVTKCASINNGIIRPAGAA